MKRDSNDRKEGKALARTFLCVMCATMFAAAAFAVLSVTDNGSDDAAVGAPGDYNSGDIDAINAMRIANDLTWPEAPDDGATVDGTWMSTNWPGVEWSSDATNKRIIGLEIDSESLTGALDVSGLTALVYLDCSDNALTGLDVSGLTALEELYCTYNRLTVLDVSDCIGLVILGCGYNMLTALDVSGCPDLELLRCNDCLIEELDLAGMTALQELYCKENVLTALNVSGCTALEMLYCEENYLTVLNVSGCTSLVKLTCLHNWITELDLAGMTELEELYCDYNRLTELVVSDSAKLNQLGCTYNKLTSLDVSACDSSLIYLDCRYNWLVDETDVGFSGTWDNTAYRFDPQFTGDVLNFVNDGFDIPALTIGQDMDDIDVSGGVGTSGESPYIFSATGLPAGFSISAAGVISGTPTGAYPAGTAIIYVRDDQGAYDRIVINYGAAYDEPVYDGTPFNIPGTYVGTAITPINVYEAISGGSGSYWIESFLIPQGIAIDPRPGIIRGAPSEPAAAGTGYLTVKDDITGFVTAIRIDVTFGAMTWPPLIFADSASYDIPTTQVGTPIASINVAPGASGGSGTYAFSASGLPLGITISAAGIISGTPTVGTAAGTATVTVTSGGLTESITIDFGAMTWPTLVFNDSASYDIPASTVGTPIASINVAPGVSGGSGTYAFSASGLPAGISISSTGIISGTPTVAAAAGTATVTVTSGGLTESITINFGEISAAPVPPGPDPEPGPEKGSNILLFVVIAIVAIAAIAAVYVFVLRPKA